MNSVTEEIYRTGKVVAADGSVHEAQPTSIAYDEGRMLYSLICENDFRHILEVGMAFGLSSLFMCDALSENGGGRLTSIDPYQHASFSGIGLSNLERAGFADMHSFLKAPSYLELPRLLAEGQRFDLVFIDGNHRYEYTLLDFFYAFRMLNVKGRIVMHDPWMPSIKKAVAFFCRNYSHCVAVDPKYTAPRAFGRAVRAFIGNLRRAPYDLYSACHFAKTQYPNYVVFQKQSECSPQDFDNAWDFYRSF